MDVVTWKYIVWAIDLKSQKKTKLQRKEIICISIEYTNYLDTSNFLALKRRRKQEQTSVLFTGQKLLKTDAGCRKSCAIDVH